MPSVRDVGTPGSPLNTPPLTDWQKAVRDVVNSSDVPLDSRIADSLAAAMAYTDGEIAEVDAALRTYTDSEVDQAADEGQAYTDQVVTVSDFPPGAPPARDGLVWVMVVPSGEPGREDDIPTIWVSTAGAWVPVISGPGGLDIATADSLYAPIDQAGSAVDDGTTDWDTLLDPGTHGVLMLGSGLNAPQTPFYYYVMVWAYSSTGNVTQLAVPYNDPEGTLHTRYRYDGVWSAWVPIGASTPPEEIDHGLLMGLGDDDHPQYGRVTVGPTAPAAPRIGDIWVPT